MWLHWVSSEPSVLCCSLFDRVSSFLGDRSAGLKKALDGQGSAMRRLRKTRRLRRPKSNGDLQELEERHAASAQPSSERRISSPGRLTSLVLRDVEVNHLIRSLLPSPSSFLQVVDSSFGEHQQLGAVLGRHSPVLIPLRRVVPDHEGPPRRTEQPHHPLCISWLCGSASPLCVIELTFVKLEAEVGLERGKKELARCRTSVVVIP